MSDGTDNFTPGRFVLSWVDADGAKDPFALTSQVKTMRECFERLNHRPALILCVVADDEEDAAVQRIKSALESDGQVRDGISEALGVLVSMAHDDEIAALEATFEEESRSDALAALREAKSRIEAEIANHNEN